MVTQLESDSSLSAGTRSGYVFVLLNSVAAGAGGVVSELLLKGGKSDSDPLAKLSAVLLRIFVWHAFVVDQAKQ